MPRAKVGNVEIVSNKQEAAAVAAEKEAEAKAGEGFTPAPNTARAEERAAAAAELEKVRDKLARVGIHEIPIEEMLNNREAMRGLEHDGLAVSDPQPGYNYGWFVKQEWSARKSDGYEFVSGAMKECREDASGFEPGYHDDPEKDEELVDRRCGELGRRQRNELTLMRIRIDHHYMLHVRHAMRRAREMHAVDEQMLEQAKREGHVLLPLGSKEMEAIRRRKGRPAKPVPIPRNPAELDRQLRDGTLGR